MMSGDRHMHLLDPVNLDGAHDVLQASKRIFGTESLEHCICTHWTAACAISVDSPAANREAVELLAANHPLAGRFGHQATIAKLLSLTPALGLYSRLRAAWVRFALYENAFSRE